MPAVRMTGKPVVEEIEARVRPEVSELRERHGIVPTLVVVQVGRDPASLRYVGRKLLAAERLGMRARHHVCDESIPVEALRDDLRRLGADPEVHGVIVQLPLPRHIESPSVPEGVDALDKFDVLDAVPPEKDVDGTGSGSIAELYRARTHRLRFLPSTALAVARLLRHYGIETRGRRAVVVGRNDITSKPILLMLGGRMFDAAAIWLHRHVPKAEHDELVRSADILVTAVGRADYRITRDMVKPGAVVFDVATRVLDDGSLVGDAEPDVQEVASFLTPVPGGVGPVTVAALMENVARAAGFAVAGRPLGYHL